MVLQMEQVGKEMAAIQAFHHCEMEAYKRGDFKALRAMVSDKAVLVPPRGARVEGTGRLDDYFLSLARKWETMECSVYTLDLRVVAVFGCYAVERGAVMTEAKKKIGGRRIRKHHEMMRILKRNDQNGWRIHRVVHADNSIAVSVRAQRHFRRGTACINSCRIDEGLKHLVIASELGHPAAGRYLDHMVSKNSVEGGGDEDSFSFGRLAYCL